MGVVNKRFCKEIRCEKQGITEQVLKILCKYSLIGIVDKHIYSEGDYDMANIERIGYKGELRIVGLIVGNNNEELGYLIMNEKNKSFKPYTVEQTKWLLQKFKFSNAEYNAKEDKLVNTECAMSRLIKFNSNLQPLENTKAMVLGKITTNGKCSGFRILSPKGVVVDVSEKECLALVDKGIDIVNAKLVNKDNTRYISAIKEEFTSIIIEQVNDKISDGVKKLSDEEIREKKIADRHEIKLEKIRKSALKVVSNFMYADKLEGCKYNLRVNSSKFNATHEKKLIKIIFEELCTSIETRKQATNIINAFKNKSLDFAAGEGIFFTWHYCDDKRSTASNMCIWLLMQLLLTDKEVRDLGKNLTYNMHRVRKGIRVKIKLESYELSKYDVEKLTEQEYRKYLNELLEILNKLQKLHLLDERVHNCISFAISTEINKAIEIKLPRVLGYKWNLKHGTSEQIFKLEDSKSVATTLDYLKLNISRLITPLNYNTGYLDISSHINNDYIELYKYIGDIIIPAKIDRILKYDSILDKLGGSTVSCTVNSADFEFTNFVSERSGLYYYNYTRVKYKLYRINNQWTREAEEELKETAMKDTIRYKLAQIEVLLAVLAIYNPDLAKKLLESLNNEFSKWEGFGGSIPELLPNFDFDNKVDYGLSDCCEDYYKSGLCAIKESDVYINIKRKNIYNTDIDRKKIYAKNKKEGLNGYDIIVKELASVVGLITSNICTPELIERFIWDNQVI